MTTYRKAFELMADVISDPTNKEKLAEAKQHPKLKKTLKGFSQEDAKVLSKVANASGKRKYPPCSRRSS